MSNIMNFAKLARKYLTNPASIRRVEEADQDISPITSDDVTNLLIDLGMIGDVQDLIDLDNHRMDWGEFQRKQKHLKGMEDELF